MAKLLITVVLLWAGLWTQVSRAQDASNDAQSQTSASLTQPVNPVVQWNRTLLSIVRTPGAQPPTIHSTRSFAILHVAIYDAVNAIDGTHKPYQIRPRHINHRASQNAAADSAAHEVLVTLYPAFQASLDAQEQTLLADIPDGENKTDGISIGKDVADQILALRSADGSNIQPPPFVFGSGPGVFQSTPPNFPKQPQFTIWSHVTPFALERASQFRPGPPPALTSDKYGDAFEEVKALGVLNNSTRTADQTVIGRFWSGAIQNYWNEITQTAAVDHNLTTAENARLFALLNLTLADSVIAFYDAKYTYMFWRPVTAIRAADPNTNPDTVPDPNWLPLTTNTPPDPSYPGAHAVISAAGAVVLESFFDSDHFQLTVTSEVLPGVTRSFTRFSDAANEAALSRIFAGNHFRFDETAGQRQGRKIADFVVDNFLRQNHNDRDDDDHDETR